MKNCEEAIGNVKNGWEEGWNKEGGEGCTLRTCIGDIKGGGWPAAAIERSPLTKLVPLG